MAPLTWMSKVSPFQWTSSWAWIPQGGPQSLPLGAAAAFVIWMCTYQEMWGESPWGLPGYSPWWALVSVQDWIACLVAPTETRPSFEDPIGTDKAEVPLQQINRLRGLCQQRKLWVLEGLVA